LILLSHTKDLLEEGQRILVPYLVKIFCALLVTVYISAIWHHVNFMFIPKQWRNSYSGPRDFSLISLTSIEMALHHLVVQVEKALDLQETALSVFLDTQGAFNNTSYESKCAALFKHGVDYTIVWWNRATSACGDSWWIFQKCCSILGLTTMRCFITAPMVPCY